MNKMLGTQYPEKFKPDLAKIQSLEEERISFQKMLMDKFIHTLTTIGQTINFVTEQCHTENDSITTVHTLDTFVRLNQTRRPMPEKVDFVPYAPTQELVKYRKELE